MIYYIIVMFLAVVLAFLSQKTVKTNDISEGDYGVVRKFRMSFFVASFLCLSLFCFITKSGQDMAAYAQYYSQWTLRDLSNVSYEPAYKLLCIVLRVFIKDPYIGLGIIKVLSLFLIYSSLFIVRDRVNLGISILMYVFLGMYFNAFHLLRIVLAVGIVYLAFSYEIIGKRKICITLLVLSFFFHYTSIIVLASYLLYRFIGKNMSVKKLILLIAATLLLYANVTTLISGLIKNIEYFNKYENYITSVEIGSGMLQVVLFIPILYILFARNRFENDDKFYILCSIIAVLSFFSGSLGYIYPVIGRTLYYTYYFAITYCASIPAKKDILYIRFGERRVSMSTLCVIAYLSINFLVNFVLASSNLEKIFARHMFIWE